MSALIPEEYGGSGLSLTEATVIMEEITRSGGNAGCCHGQMYNMNTLLRNGSEAQKQKYMPKIATGELRLQAMGVTEPSAGTDTTTIKTTVITSYSIHYTKLYDDGRSERAEVEHRTLAQQHRARSARRTRNPGAPDQERVSRPLRQDVPAVEHRAEVHDGLSPAGACGSGSDACLRAPGP